jgi:hypothetical protein
MHRGQPISLSTPSPPCYTPGIIISARRRTMPDSHESSENSGAPDMKIPNACCGCLGEAQAALQLTGQFYESAGLMKYREIKRVVQVPICMACAAKEKSIQTARWIIAAVCGIPFVVLGIIFKDAIIGAMDMPVRNFMDLIMYHIATFIWGFVLGLIPAYFYVAKRRAVNVDKSGKVHFKNEEYRRRLQEMNE